MTSKRIEHMNQDLKVIAGSHEMRKARRLRGPLKSVQQRENES